MLCPSLMEQRRVEQPSLSTHRELLVVDQPVSGAAASAPSRAWLCALQEPHRQDCLCHKLSQYNCRWTGALVCWEYDAVEETIPRRPPLLQELLQVHP
jgi:hypothetical protein